MLNECHGIGTHPLFTANEAHTFGGSGLNGNFVGMGTEYLGNTCLHGWDMRVELGLFGTDGGIDVA